jgi:hypothetical protein
VLAVEIETMLVAGQDASSRTGIDIGDLRIGPDGFVGEAALILTFRLFAKPTSASTVAMGLVDGVWSGRYTGAGIERCLRDGLSE